VMSRCAFDCNATMLKASETTRLVSRNGFNVVRTDYRFFFPRSVRWFRVFESRLVSIPLGAQYLVLCRRPV
jgi:hypothetical protein